MISFNSNDIETFSMVPPPPLRLIGFDKRALPEYLAKLQGNEEAP